MRLLWIEWFQTPDILSQYFDLGLLIFNIFKYSFKENNVDNIIKRFPLHELVMISDMI